MIDRCRGAFPIRMMCRHLEVSPSGYYDWRARPPSARANANALLTDRIKALHEASDGVLGRRRIHEDLRDEGETCSVNRVGRLMRQAGLHGLPQKKRWRRKASSPRPTLVHNHLNREFQAPEPNTRWATDMT
jgi:putative transposase